MNKSILVLHSSNILRKHSRHFYVKAKSSSISRDGGWSFWNGAEWMMYGAVVYKEPVLSVECNDSSCWPQVSFINPSRTGQNVEVTLVTQQTWIQFSGTLEVEVDLLNPKARIYNIEYVKKKTIIPICGLVYVYHACIIRVCWSFVFGGLKWNLTNFNKTQCVSRRTHACPTWPTLTPEHQI